MRQKGEEESEQEEVWEEESDPEVSAMTELEVYDAKSALKDKVKDKSQAALDEARDSVDDTVRRKMCF